jgi:hypothetical protein
MKTMEEPYKRECEHTEKCHWKECAECREYLVRSGFEEEVSLAITADRKELIDELVHEVTVRKTYANSRDFSDGHVEELIPKPVVISILKSKKK